MEETVPGVDNCIISYVIGLDSLKAASNGAESSWNSCGDIRLRMDGLFKLKEHAVQLTKEFTALYTNGPAGGGGIRYSIHVYVCYTLQPFHYPILIVASQYQSQLVLIRLMNDVVT